MSNEPKSRRRFDRAFKHNALRMIFDEGIPLEEVARKLDIHRNMLCRWKQQYKADADHAFPGQGQRQESLAEENRRLHQGTGGGLEPHPMDAVLTPENLRNTLEEFLTICARRTGMERILAIRRQIAGINYSKKTILVEFFYGRPPEN